MFITADIYKVSCHDWIRSGVSIMVQQRSGRFESTSTKSLRAERMNRMMMMDDADEDLLEKRFSGEQMEDGESNETDENAEPPTDVHLLNDLLKEGDKRRVAPKTRVLRPQPKLREQELCGPRGIMSLKKMFDGYKPNPKKNPYEKLADVMNKIEYWAHLLHPKMKFEDVIDSIETLGGKRAVKTYMEKMRMDMPLTDEDFASISNPDGASPSKTREEGEEDATAAIEPSGTGAVVTNPPDEDYDDFIDDFYNEPSSSVNAFETPQTQNVSQSVELTEAQRERIAANKRRAEELRAKREAMLKQIEQGTSNEKHEDVQPSQTNLQTGSSTEETSQIVSTTEMSTDMMDDSDAMDYIFSTD